MQKNKYKVVYVDESDADQRKFQLFNYKQDNFFDEVVIISPTPDLADLIELIISAHPDALVVDFRLSEENSEIKYDGGDVVRDFLKEKPSFPVFILTTYEDDAIDEGPDVNIVNGKKRVFDNDRKLLEKFEAQIKKYQLGIKDKEERFKWLINEEKKRELTDFETEEMNDLDDFLQKSLSGTSIISKSSRETNNQKRLTDLLEKADKILKKLSE